MTFVDTNYFLRFLLRDNESQYEKTKQLFIEASNGEIELTTSVIVFFEVYWVLKSFYGKSKSELCEILDKLLALTFIHLEEREILKNSLQFYEAYSLSFEDCYNLIYIKERGVKDLRSFDNKLLKVFRKLFLN